MPEADDFDLLIQEAERLINSRGVVIPKPGATVDDVHPATIEELIKIVREAERRSDLWRTTGRAIRSSWRGAVWAVAGWLAQEIALDLISDAGMDAALTTATDPERQNNYRRLIEDQLMRPCPIKRDTSTKLITFAALEARRMKGQDWMDRAAGWAKMADPVTEGAIRAYQGIAEAMMQSFVAAYAGRGLGRNKAKVRKQRVRSIQPVRKPGRPKEGKGDPRERGEWGKKHPIPLPPW